MCIAGDVIPYLFLNSKVKYLEFHVCICIASVHGCATTPNELELERIEQVISEKGKTSDKCKRRAHNFILLGLVKISMELR